jgi:hypothetical protein
MSSISTRQLRISEEIVFDVTKDGTVSYRGVVLRKNIHTGKNVINHKGKRYTVGKLVYHAFFPPYIKNFKLGRKDKDDLNDHIDNLIPLGLNSKEIVRLDSRNNVIGEYSSVRDAAKACGVNESNVSLICKGRILNSSWKFKYKQSVLNIYNSGQTLIQEVEPIPGHLFKVTNFGKVFIPGIFLSSHMQSGVPYIFYKTVLYSIRKLVFHAFFPPYIKDSRIVNIDGNVFNNDISNLGKYSSRWKNRKGITENFPISSRLRKDKINLEEPPKKKLKTLNKKHVFNPPDEIFKSLHTTSSLKYLDDCDEFTLSMKEAGF